MKHLCFTSPMRNSTFNVQNMSLSSYWWCDAECKILQEKQFYMWNKLKEKRLQHSFLNLKQRHSNKVLRGYRVNTCAFVSWLLSNSFFWCVLLHLIVIVFRNDTHAVVKFSYYVSFYKIQESKSKVQNLLMESTIWSTSNLLTGKGATYKILQY